MSWADYPEFPNHLMQTSYQFFSQYFNITQDSIRNIQYKQLLEWTKEFLYFNTMTNPVDRSVISMYLDDYIGQFLFEQHNPFRSAFTTREALEEIITEKIEELKNIPAIKSNMIMLGAASDDLYQMKASSKLSSYMVRFFGDQRESKMNAALLQLSLLQKVLDNTTKLEPFPFTHLVRWQIVGFEVNHVKAAAKKLMEDVENMTRCLIDGDWPSKTSEQMIQDILENRTPKQWRYVLCVLICLII